MYRLIVDSWQGMRLEVDRLHVVLCLPAQWDALKIHCRYRETAYPIDTTQTRAGKGGRGGVTPDGVEQDGKAIPLVDDHREHTVDARLPTV